MSHFPSSENVIPFCEIKRNRERGGPCNNIQNLLILLWMLSKHGRKKTSLSHFENIERSVKISTFIHGRIPVTINEAPSFPLHQCFELNRCFSVAYMGNASCLCSAPNHLKVGPNLPNICRFPQWLIPNILRNVVLPGRRGQ